MRWIFPGKAQFKGALDLFYAGTTIARRSGMVPRNFNSEGAGLSGVGTGRNAVTDGLIRIWLVDDSSNFRLLLAEMLEEEAGFVCSGQFSTAEEVLDAFEKTPQENQPDIVLLDLRMPGMGGLAAVRHLKKMAIASRIVMLTTFSDLGAKAQAMSDGASDFLLKSYQLQEIVERIRAVHTGPFREPIDLPVEEASTEWPTHRGSVFNDARPEVIQGSLPPQSGYGSEAGVGECTSNRLARGVHFLRGLFAAATGRGQSRKSVNDLVTVR